MSRLMGATIKDFKDTIERLRGVYPFKDEYTEIVNTFDLHSNAHRVLSVRTYEPKADVYITLDTEVLHDGKKVGPEE